MGSQQLREDLGLRLAQLRELLGDVRYGAVVLAELLADRCAARRGSVPVRAQGLGQGLRPLLGGGGLDRLAVRAGLLGDPRAGEGDDRLVPAEALLDPAQGVGGELVVGLVEGVPAAVGEGEDLRRLLPRVRAPYTRCSRGCTTSSATSASRWRRTAAG